MDGLVAGVSDTSGICEGEELCWCRCIAPHTVATKKRDDLHMANFGRRGDEITPPVDLSWGREQDIHPEIDGVSNGLSRGPSPNGSSLPLRAKISESIRVS